VIYPLKVGFSFIHLVIGLVVSRKKPNYVATHMPFQRKHLSDVFGGIGARSKGVCVCVSVRVCVCYPPCFVALQTPALYYQMFNILNTNVKHSQVLSSPSTV
jgi:hypothetical protein